MTLLVEPREITTYEKEQEKYDTHLATALSGGKRRTDIMELVPGSGKKICFCEDPFGNVIEIYSHSYEQFWANAQF